MTTDEQAATWQPQPVGAGSHVPNGQQLALALAPLVEASVNAAVAPLRAELAEVRSLLSQRDQELGRLRTLLEAPREPTTAEIAPERAAANGAVEPTQTSSERRNGRPWWRFWRSATA